MNRTTRNFLVALTAVAFIVTGTGCSVSTQPDQVALAYNDGPLSPRTFDKCIPSSKREGQGPNDVAFSYPANQRTDNFTGDDGSDRGPFTIVSKDGVQMQFPGNLQFLLNTDCKTLRAFHEKIGNRYKAYFSGDESEGWGSQVLPLYIEQPLQTALASAASQFTWRDLYNKPDVRVQVQRAVTESLPGVVNDQTEGDEEFFKNFVVTLQVPDPPQALKDAITNEQTVVAQANAASAQAGAQVAQAKAETQVAVERAKQQAAQIAGFPNVAAYLDFIAINKGLNPKQPTYIVPGTQPTG
jgi:hypothetical protein